MIDPQTIAYNRMNAILSQFEPPTTEKKPIYTRQGSRILGRQGLDKILQEFPPINGHFGECDFPCHRCGFNHPRICTRPSKYNQLYIKQGQTRQAIVKCTTCGKIKKIGGSQT